MERQRLHSVLDLNKLKRFLTKGYRDSYLEAMARTGVAFQIRAMRKKLGMSQSAFGKHIGKSQPEISRLENEEYGQVSLTTLLDVATALDVGLLVRFVEYPQVLEAASKMSERDLQPDTIYDTIARANVPVSLGLSIWNVDETQAPQSTTAGRQLEIGKFPFSTLLNESSEHNKATPSGRVPWS